LTKPIRRARLFDAISQIVGGDVKPSVADAPAGLAAAPPAGSDAAPAELSATRVLLAEDNEVNRAVATITLRKRGFAVEVAVDGAAAVEMAADGAYAAIFMDCQMPRLDGYDATREIRRREGGGTRTPIIAMTANAMAGDRELCLAAGMDDYLSKPLRVEELERVLELWVRNPNTAGAADAHAGVDSAVLAQLREDLADDELFTQLMELYSTDAKQRMADLDAALAAGDANALALTAHTLKGSAANVGAVQVARLAARVEHHARENDTDELPELVAVLRDEVARAESALRTGLAVA
jgi:two-component system sensor histidine kinase/response regulator